jgi:uncharacterized protein (DUF885 family)
MGAGGPYILTQLSGPQLELPRLLLTQHELRTKADALAYIDRLNALGRVMNETRESLVLDAEAGTVPPAFALEGAAAGIERFLEPEVEAHPLYTHFAGRIDSMDGLSEEDRRTLRGRATVAIQTSVYPAYRELAAELRGLVPAAGSGAGVWRLQDGAAFYTLSLRNFGAGEMSADEVHEYGLAEVARISDRMDAIMNELGRPPAETAGLRFAALGEDPSVVYPDTEAARDEILGLLEEQVRAVEAIAPDWFGTLPPQDVEVRRIPVHEQDAAARGYYTPPSLDGTRPGIYWINLKDPRDWPKYTLKTLTYHEAIPGHHFQIALQQDVPDMPLIRNLVLFSEFAEGWALYAEELAAEMGLYADDPLGDLGRLQSELFRAARLVVDTGLHHKRWSREEAIDWMVRHTGRSEASVTREVERYAVWPGQATSYKLGMKKILELRERAETALGDRFDIRAFHDVVLLDGAVPLPVLEATVDSWIEEQLTAG